MKVPYQLFDPENWARKHIYNFYKGFTDPFFNITANINITRMYHESKEKGYSFLLSSIYYMLLAANKIENFRLRFAENELRLLDKVHGGSTILYDDESFGYAYYTLADNLDKFQELSLRRIEWMKKEKYFNPDNARYDLIYFTSFPWASFTGIKHAFDPRINPSIPRISFGKYFRDSENILLPVNVEVNHALMDGLHVGRLMNLFEELCK